MRKQSLLFLAIVFVFSASDIPRPPALSADPTPPFLQAQKIKFPASKGMYLPAAAVALGPDYAVIGLADRGEAHIYYSAGGRGAFRPLKKLTAGEDANFTEEANGFGCAVAAAGDLVIVGTLCGNEAYLFSRNSGGKDDWGEVKRLFSPAGNSMNLGSFGWSVALSADYALVGSHSTNSAELFARDSGGKDNWGRAKRFSGTEAAEKDFGGAVAVWNGYALVGAPKTNAAFLYARDAGGEGEWGLVKRLEAAGAQGYERFGFSVAGNGDDLVVGAPAHLSGVKSGAAFVFSKNAGGADNWGQVKKLLAGDALDFSALGSAVALSGDYALVGSFGEEDEPFNRGAAYVFSRNQGGKDKWGKVKRLLPADSHPGDRFGKSAALSGSTALVGTKEASAYVFR